MARREGAIKLSRNRHIRRSAAIALSLTVGGLVSLVGAQSASAATQSVPGVSATVTSTYAELCTSSTMMWGDLWYTESEIPGKEIGRSFSSPHGRCLHQTPITSKSRFRSFHVCNSNGVCGREVYL